MSIEKVRMATFGCTCLLLIGTIVAAVVLNHEIDALDQQEKGLHAAVVDLNKQLDGIKKQTSAVSADLSTKVVRAAKPDRAAASPRRPPC